MYTCIPNHVMYVFLVYVIMSLNSEHSMVLIQKHVPIAQSISRGKVWKPILGHKRTDKYIHAGNLIRLPLALCPMQAVDSSFEVQSLYIRF